MRSLSDVMSSADLSLYPIVGLVLFMTAFTLIVYYAFAKRNRETFEQARQIPLADDVVMPRNAEIPTQPGDEAMRPNDQQLQTTANLAPGSQDHRGQAPSKDGCAHE